MSNHTFVFNGTLECVQCRPFAKGGQQFIFVVRNDHGTMDFKLKSSTGTFRHLLGEQVVVIFKGYNTVVSISKKLLTMG